MPDRKHPGRFGARPDEGERPRGVGGRFGPREEQPQGAAGGVGVGSDVPRFSVQVGSWESERRGSSRGGIKYM